MALDSYPRVRERSALSGRGRPRRQRRRGGGRVVAGVVLLVAVFLTAAAALLLVSARASLSADETALAKIGLPLGGGRIESVTVVSGPHSGRIPVQLRGTQIWPRGLIPARERLSIDVVIKRPGWISWLAGSTEHLRLGLVTPDASLRQQYLTLAPGAPLRVEFTAPVRTISYGAPGHVKRHLLTSPQSAIVLDRSADAGTMSLAAAPRTWETAPLQMLSWFPSGAAAAAVAVPAPGATIRPDTPITLTFSKPVGQVLGSSRPPVSPATPGTWQPLGSHSIVFRPTGYGYGLGATVNVGLPAGVRLVGGNANGSGTWRVPPGSTLRLHQLLAMLGYLPLRFEYAGAGVARSPHAQEQAAIHPPAGSFTWRYPNVPAVLRGFWAPGAAGVMTRGAVMAFENDHGLAPDGVAGPIVWRALIGAALSGRTTSFGYSFVSVDMGSSPESLTLWHDGRTVLTTAVNTGIASAPTAPGTFAVYEHIRVGTMSGTNPDGSHYNDPGIQYISYFNGGDALHAFDRAQFGFPQSLGCVEMALGSAAEVWPYTPIGTLVHVS